MKATLIYLLGLFMMGNICFSQQSSNEEIFSVVETMPRLDVCENEGFSTDDEREDCAKQAMLQFIYKNITYPKEAKTKGIEGIAVVQFVVTKSGNMDNIQVVRDPGGGCGAAAKQTMERMNDAHTWVPGKLAGQDVNVKYVLPVKFKL